MTYDIEGGAAKPVYMVGGSITTTTTLEATTEVRKQTPTGKALNVQIGPGDVISNIPVVIEFDHHQIHEGETWQYTSYGALNSATRNIRISVPLLEATTRTPHLLPEVICDATTASILLFEGTTWTAVGTDDSAKIYNRNRNVIGSPKTKIYVTGATTLTPNADGVQIYQGYTVGANRSAVGSDRTLAEWDLKSNTEYCFRVTTTSNGICLIRLNFYEDLGV